MKVGDLVKLIIDDGPFGFVMRIDEDHYGSRQALKIYQKIPRGMCIRGNQVDGLGPTKDGIRDRVLVLWPNHGWEYCESTELEVLSESG